MTDIHESTASDQSRQRILVVEDNKALRLHACTVLDTFGFDVCEASSGEQALQLLNRGCVDAVLLDVRMPGMDGFETCRRIRALQGCESLSVIVTTGLDDHQAVDTGFDAGASDFVIKPINWPINWPILKRRILSTINARVTAEELPVSGDDRRGLSNTLRDAVLRLDSDDRVLHTRCRTRVGTSATRSVARSAIAAIREGQNQARFEFNIDFDSGSRSYEVDLAAGGRGEIVALVRDCTERCRAKARIRQLAYYNGVTGLPNRELLQLFVDEKLKDARHAGRCVTVMRLEVKGLDDTRSLLGNQRADDLLRMCADRLRHSVGVPEDSQPEVRTLVGRTGDVGFAIARDNLPGDETLRSFAECLQDAMTGSYSLNGY